MSRSLIDTSARNLASSEDIECGSLDALDFGEERPRRTIGLLVSIARIIIFGPFARTARIASRAFPRAVVSKITLVSARRLPLVSI
jgi:hypothetical protein